MVLESHFYLKFKGGKKTIDSSYQFFRKVVKKKQSYMNTPEVRDDIRTDASKNGLLLRL